MFILIYAYVMESCCVCFRWGNVCTWNRGLVASLQDCVKRTTTDPAQVRALRESLRTIERDEEFMK